ncbi:unnamed protein product [Brachionus calyciflorus]|uniref:Peroxisomal membrane protein 11C n=1 Tax=Brachionus calyciflorus TaxID=104777 RepID=A0A813TQH6_9BILA|nr:unnamed protein product [Brachionus calyciflorus]
MNILSNTSNLLETYRGHDAVLSVVNYGLTAYSGLVSKKNSDYSKKLYQLSSQISNARVILRLLDDPSMLAYTLSYGLGKHEKSLIVSALNVMNNLASHVYYIFEHLAWLADNKILNMKSEISWLVSTVAWLISLIASIICNFISLKNMLLNLKHLYHKDKQTLKKELLTKRFFIVYLKIIEDFSWIINYIHWLPPGILWSGKLSNFQSGMLGVLSSLCNLIPKFF